MQPGLVWKSLHSFISCHPVTWCSPFLKWNDRNLICALAAALLNVIVLVWCYFFSICCLHSKRLYFVFVMSEFSAGLTAGKSFSGAASADLQCRACRSSLGLLPLVCVLLCISFFRLHLPTPLSSLGASEGSHSSLWARVKYACTCVLVHLGVYTAMDTSIHFSQPAEELLQPCISSHAPRRWACSFENWPLILPPCFPLLRYFQSLSLSQIP